MSSLWLGRTVVEGAVCAGGGGSGCMCVACHWQDDDEDKRLCLGSSLGTEMRSW